MTTKDNNQPSIKEKVFFSIGFVGIGAIGFSPFLLIGGGLVTLVRDIHYRNNVEPGLVAQEREAFRPTAQYSSYFEARKACEQQIQTMRPGTYCLHMDTASGDAPDGVLYSRYSDHLRTTTGLPFHTYDDLGTVYTAHADLDVSSEKAFIYSK